MPPPLIAAKLDLPRLPALHLERPRLDALWEACRGRRLLLVTAGAGFGKTAFLARAAACRAGPVAWLSLDEGDAEPATFARHLHQALQRVCGSEAGAPPDVEPEEQLAAALALLRAAEAPCLLVLDDAHLAAAAPAARELMERLLRHLPAGVTLALLSREHLELTTASLQAAGELATVGAVELAFSAEEIAGLCALRFRGRRDRYLRALERLLVQLTEAARWAELPPLCRQGLQQDPFAEGLHWHLVQAESRLGQRREALADFQRYERLILQEPGLPPSPRLQSLAERISRPELPPAAAPGPAQPGQDRAPARPPSPRRRGADR